MIENFIPDRSFPLIPKLIAPLVDRAMDTECNPCAEMGISKTTRYSGNGNGKQMTMYRNSDTTVRFGVGGDTKCRENEALPDAKLFPTLLRTRNC